MKEIIKVGASKPKAIGNGPRLKIESKAQNTQGILNITVI